ncbi:protein PLASTID MOVEMENT IMPAIRED 1-RELATED 1 [Citrus sinensis]|uniref:Uncharacterized protein ORF16 n=1 Tax=Citrus unshiu TaxID=55188 RepID=F8WL83_CITUN|nr:protein PLASTID MOVEMENT IMPAIRED 1-RELATED 2 [Citrus sinensis]KAH9653227.1 protein PLASTID MOVEMENT IMPAIRED 1-RELATED 1 [Citrus sinensis]BAK61828.1 hypothetical protein [Citrus unshiu]
MSLSKIDLENDSSDRNSSSSRLLHDIEAISKALYLQRPPPKSLIFPYERRSKSAERTRFTEPKSNPNSGNFNEKVLQKNKKSSSLWNWKKPLKALAHIRDHRFNICFFLHVHSIEGLPMNFNDCSLHVFWKRKDDVLATRPSRILQGTAEFEETLMYKCSVYGGRSGAHSSAKYEVKLSLIYASVVGAPGVDTGKHWVDLTRLLPLTLEELEGEKSVGTWTTSFKLAEKAKGATLNVSFGFKVMKDNLSESKNNRNVSELINLTEDRSMALESVKGLAVNNYNEMLKRVGSVPRNSSHRSFLSYTSHEVSPILGLELSKSINFLYEKLNEANLNGSKEFNLSSEYVEPPNNHNFESAKDFGESEFDCSEFTVVEKGIEVSEKEHLEPKGSVQTIDDPVVETINVDEITGGDNIALEEKMKSNSKEDTCGSYIDEVLVNDGKHEDRILCTTGSTIQELELIFDDMFISELKDLESPLAIDELLEQENYTEIKSNYRASKTSKTSLSLDDATESVASDFLKMLGIDQASSGFTSDSNPESPRELLLREFEKEALNSGSSIFDFDVREEDQLEFSCNAPTGSSSQDSCRDFVLFPIIQGSDGEHNRADQLLKNRRKANILEDLETECLMREWGLNESAFQSSPRYCSDGFGSPVELPPEDTSELPPLGDGFGPLIETKSGGYLRSMNPSLLRNAKNLGSLVMQVSRPVVLPAEVGSEIIDILQHLASVGIKKLSMQLNKLMPLEDITGKTLQEVAQEAAPRTLVSERQTSLQYGSLFAQDSFAGREKEEELRFGWTNDCMRSSLIVGEMGKGFLSTTDFACLAMNGIEALLIDGLRIQCGMSDEDAPSCIRTHSAGLQLSDVRDGANDIDELMDLSVTLDEWLNLDNGIIDDEDQISLHTVKTAHHSQCIDFVSGTLIREVSCDKASGKTHTLLRNNFTVALMVLLRDPLRNYEPVGTSMLALFQVERIFGHVKPKIYSAMRDRNERTDGEANSEEEEVTVKRGEEKEEYKETTPWFKLSEVHLAGLNAELGKNHLWGSRTQQQSGTRWLLASGMAKSKKYSLSNSKAIVISNRLGPKKVQNEDVLWSITSSFDDAGTNWKELTALVPYIRNPDFVFPPNENPGSHVI